MTESWPQLLEHLTPLLMVMFRLGGLMVFGPVFGSPVIPLRIKVFLSLLVAIAVYPLLLKQGFIGPMQLNLWTLGLIIAAEALVGLIIGFVASLPLVGVQTGGLIMGQQMGLGFARFYNPAVDDEADVIGQLLFFLGLAGFLIIGGHEAMLLAVLHSFEHIPTGSIMVDVPLLDLLTGLLLSAFELALRVAAPLLALIFLETLAMGFVSKTVPQLNILSLGFPLRIMAGIAIVGLGLFVINDVMMEAIDETVHVIFDWIELPSSSTAAEVADG